MYECQVCFHQDSENRSFLVSVCRLLNGCDTVSSDVAETAARTTKFRGVVAARSMDSRMHAAWQLTRGAVALSSGNVVLVTLTG